MIPFVVAFLLCWFACAPLLTLAHELGHALLPIFLGHHVSIAVGSLDFQSVGFAIGNLKISFGSFLKPWCGFTSWDSTLSPSLEILSIALGPLVSLIVSILLFLLYRRSRSQLRPLLLATAIWAAVQSLTTAMPVLYPAWMGYRTNQPSDGLQVIELLKRRF